MTDVKATDGRVIGSRASQTRARLLEATAKLLDERGAFDLKVIDVTREAKTSPATFYQYFNDVSDAILDLAQQAGDDSFTMLTHFDDDWKGDAGRRHVEEFTREYIAHWQSHKSILRVRNMQAEEGNQRFREVRGAAVQPFMQALITKIDASKAQGRISSHLNSYAAAAAVIAMMERLVAYLPEFDRRGVHLNDMVETLSTLILRTVTGEEF